MVRQLQTGQKIKRCEICGTDMAGMEEDVCYLCKTEITPEVREKMK